MPPRLAVVLQPLLEGSTSGHKTERNYVRNVRISANQATGQIASSITRPMSPAASAAGNYEDPSASDGFRVLVDRRGQRVRGRPPSPSTMGSTITGGRGGQRHQPRARLR